MKEIVLPLKKNYERPLIEIDGTPALIDTGAIIPFFSLPSLAIKNLFGGRLIIENKYFGGFGGNEYGSVYALPDFKIGELHFMPLEVFVPYLPKIRFPFLFSATMFYGWAYEFDTINAVFRIKMKDEQSARREFKIINLRGKLYAQIDGVLLQNEDTELVDPAVYSPLSFDD